MLQFLVSQLVLGLSETDFLKRAGSRTEAQAVVPRIFGEACLRHESRL